MSDGPQFVDAESYQGSSSKDQITFREIALMHVRKLTQLACVEWHGGYWQTKTRQVGPSAVVEKYYVQDSRECFSNGVRALADILFAHFDKKMVEAENKIRARLQELEKQEKPGKRAFVLVYCDYFRYLCSFLKRNGYLEGRSYSEEA